jgi:hypothetical protein
VGFACHAITLEGRKDPRLILQILASQDFIVVTIADSPESRPVAFSAQNLDVILSGDPEIIFVEGLPVREFKGRMREDLGQMIEAALGLRATLRGEYVHDLEARIREFLSRLEQILTMIRCYALQSSDSTAVHLKKLEQDLGTFAESCFERGDNVCCMDDLQYQILPSLKMLQKIFRK